MLAGALILMLCWLGALGAGVVHAADGVAHFDIEPTFAPYREMRPRANFVYESTSGALIEDSLHVKNTGSARGTTTIYPVDATTSQNSGEAFLTHRDPRRDVGAWITLKSQQVTLDPGQSQDIPFNLRVPTHARPGQHVGGFVAEEPVQQQSSSQGAIQSTVQLHLREIIGVLMTLPGTKVERVQATGVTYDTTSVYQRLLIGLANTGTQILHPVGSLHVLDQNGQPLQAASMRMESFLAQTAIAYPVYMHHTALTPGTYTATLSLEYEGHHALHYTTTFVVPHPPLPHLSLPPAITDVVTLSANLFSDLAPWDYLIGLALLMLILSALFFWRLHKLGIQGRRNANGRNRRP